MYFGSFRTWAHPLIEKGKGAWDMFGRLKQVPFDKIGKQQ